MSWIRVFTLLGLASALSLAIGYSSAAQDDPPGAYKAPFPEPTATETALLEYINRCRADPAADALRCVSLKGIPQQVNRDLFLKEMAQEKSAPPLVFDLRLLKAARWHSHYQLLNSQTHDEAPGATGFTGKSPWDRLKLAGYEGSAGENIARDMDDPWEAHCAFVIDWGEGPGYMQPGRGHRRNILNAQMNLGGIAALLHPGKTKVCVTHEFGVSEERWLGGVVINDRNRNRVYDIGEGIGKVPIVVGEAKTVSWASGAYVLPISKEAAKLVTTISGKKYAVYLPAGTDNVKFDIFVSDRSSYDRMAYLLRSAKQLPKTDGGNARRRSALVDLYLASQQTLSPEGLTDEIQELTADSAKELEKDMAAVREGLAEKNPDDVKKEIQAAQKKYAKTKAQKWFAQALACVQMKQAHRRLEDQQSSGKLPTKAAVEAALRSQNKLSSSLVTPEWKQTAAAIMNQTAALTPDYKAPAK